MLLVRKSEQAERLISTLAAHVEVLKEKKELMSLYKALYKPPRLLTVKVAF